MQSHENKNIVSNIKFNKILELWNLRTLQRQHKYNEMNKEIISENNVHKYVQNVTYKNELGEKMVNSDSWKSKNVKGGNVKKCVKKNEKNSIGVACCRIKKNKPEILLIQKRYTYAYCEFVHGQYSVEFNLLDDVKDKLSRMTLDEKLDILTFDFDKMWYRIWLDAPKVSSYITAKIKFENLIKDDGVKLRKLIEKSKTISLLWEIPKGMKKKNESNVNAAVREFEEETNITKQMYKIFPNVSIKYKYMDGITYNVQYYIAMAKKNIVPEINLASKEQIKEISAIKWASIEEVRFLSDQNDKANNLEQIVSSIFKIVKTRK